MDIYVLFLFNALLTLREIIGMFFVLGSVLFTVALIVDAIHQFDAKVTDTCIRLLAKMRKWLTVILAAATIFIVIPSQERAYTIAGIYLITNVKDIDKLPDNAVNFLNRFLEEAATTKEE